MGRPNLRKAQKAARRRRERLASERAREERQRLQGQRERELALDAALGLGCPCCDDLDLDLDLGLDLHLDLDEVERQVAGDTRPLAEVIRQLAPRGREACLAAALGAVEATLPAFDRGGSECERLMAHAAAETLSRALHRQGEPEEVTLVLSALERVVVGEPTSARDWSRRALRHTLLCARATELGAATDEAVRAVEAAARAVARELHVRVGVECGLRAWDRTRVREEREARSA